MMNSMRKSITLAAAVVGIAFAAAGSAKAEVYYPWCAYYSAWTYNCGFTTLQQCRVTVFGQPGECRPNPQPPPGGYSERRRKPRKKPRS
jgi:hypothetical protein